MATTPDHHTWHECRGDCGPHMHTTTMAFAAIVTAEGHPWPGAPMADPTRPTRSTP